MDSELEYLCHEIDASVTGTDKLHNPVDLAEFQEYVLRWWRMSNQIGIEIQKKKEASGP